MESKFEIVPIAQLKPGLFLKGKLTGEMGKQVKLTDKKSGRDYFKYVYNFMLLDCSDDLKFSAKNPETRSYDEVTPLGEDKIAVWTTKTLHEKLAMFPEGTVLRVAELPAEDAGQEFKRRKFEIKMEKE